MNSKEHEVLVKNSMNMEEWVFVKLQRTMIFYFPLHQSQKLWHKSMTVCRLPSRQEIAWKARFRTKNRQTITVSHSRAQFAGRCVSWLWAESIWSSRQTACDTALLGCGPDTRNINGHRNIRIAYSCASPVHCALTDLTPRKTLTPL